jgi:hypothetical protein
MWNGAGYVSLGAPGVRCNPNLVLVAETVEGARPYPPGPKGYPLIGNLLDFPVGVPLWEGLTDVAKQHGRILPSHNLSRSKC